jgi:hypothetical protein
VVVAAAKAGDDDTTTAAATNVKSFFIPMPPHQKCEVDAGDVGEIRM